MMGSLISSSVRARACTLLRNVFCRSTRETIDTTCHAEPARAAPVPVLRHGATTQYAYDARNRRLANLQAVTQGRTIQNLHYRYDNVGNILGLANNVPVPPPNLMGRPHDPELRL